MNLFFEYSKLMNIKIETEINTMYYNIETGMLEDMGMPLCNNMEYTYSDMMPVFIKIKNVICDYMPHIEYSDTNLKISPYTMASIDYDIIYNGFNYINFMDEIGMENCNAVISYMENRDMNNEDFYMIPDDELLDIELPDDDYNILKNALHNITIK